MRRKIACCKDTKRGFTQRRRSFASLRTGSQRRKGKAASPLRSPAAVALAKVALLPLRLCVKQLTFAPHPHGFVYCSVRVKRQGCHSGINRTNKRPEMITASSLPDYFLVSPSLITSYHLLHYCCRTKFSGT